jgi:hypothetical protein
MPGASATSGSRIALIREQFVGADGAATVPTERLRDRKLDADCSLGLASDGVIRCLPSAALADNPLGWNSFFNNNVFADPSCTVPLARAARNPRKYPTPPYVAAPESTRASAGTDQPRLHIYTVAREYPVGEPVFSTFNTTGGCAEVDGMPPPWYFEVGTEIAPTEFVAFTKSVVSANKGSPANPAAVAPTSGSRISVSGEQFVGADGTTTTPKDFRYRDEKLGVQCEMAVAADCVTRCLPGGASVRWVFADDKCTIPLADVNVPLAPGIPSYASQQGRPTMETCGIKSVIHVFPIDAERAASSPLFFSGSGKCEQFKNRSYRAFALGAEVPPTDFVAFTSPDAARSYRGPRKAR